MSVKVREKRKMACFSINNYRRKQYDDTFHDEYDNRHTEQNTLKSSFKLRLSKNYTSRINLQGLVKQ